MAAPSRMGASHARGAARSTAGVMALSWPPLLSWLHFDGIMVLHAGSLARSEPAAGVGATRSAAGQKAVAAASSAAAGSRRVAAARPAGGRAGALDPGRRRARSVSWTALPTTTTTSRPRRCRSARSDPISHLRRRGSRRRLRRSATQPRTCLSARLPSARWPTLTRGVRSGKRGGRRPSSVGTAMVAARRRRRSPCPRRAAAISASNDEACDS